MQVKQLRVLIFAERPEGRYENDKNTHFCMLSTAAFMKSKLELKKKIILSSFKITKNDKKLAKNK